MNIALKNPLSGIVPPLLDNETLDVVSLEYIIKHLIAGGVHGLFILGTTGEEQSLSYRIRKQMIEHTCRINNGRLSVLVCITGTSIAESINLARIADDFVASPFYKFHAPEREKIQRALEALPIQNGKFII